MTQQPQLAAPDPRAAQFRWDTVPRSYRDWLKTQTENIVASAYRQVCDSVRIGGWLAEARGKLKRRTFLAWVASELPFSRPTAYRLMRLAAVFGGHALSQFEKFDLSALYILAEPRTPDAAREHAVALADGGTPVTRAVAMQILDAHRETPAARITRAAKPAKLLRCLGMVRDKATNERVQCGNEVRTDGGVRFCRACRDRAEGDQPRDLTLDQYRKRWGAFEELARTCTELRVERVLDHDYDPDVEVLYSVSCRRPDPACDLPRNAVAGDLYDALSRLAGVEETQFCAKCQTDKPLVDFSKNALNRSGRNYRCRDCEKARRGAMRAEKRSKREAERAPLSPPPGAMAA